MGEEIKRTSLLYSSLVSGSPLAIFFSIGPNDDGRQNLAESSDTGPAIFFLPGFNRRFPFFSRKAVIKH